MRDVRLKKVPPRVLNQDLNTLSLFSPVCVRVCVCENAFGICLSKYASLPCFQWNVVVLQIKGTHIFTVGINTPFSYLPRLRKSVLNERQLLTCTKITFIIFLMFLKAITEAFPKSLKNQVRLLPLERIWEKMKQVFKMRQMALISKQMWHCLVVRSSSTRAGEKNFRMPKNSDERWWCWGRAFLWF